VISPSQRPLPTQDNTTYKHKRQTSVPSAGLEPAIPATKRPQTYALDSAATGIGYLCICVSLFCKRMLKPGPRLTVLRLSTSSRRNGLLLSYYHNFINPSFYRSSNILFPRKQSQTLWDTIYFHSSKTFRSCSTIFLNTIYY
jgi:hypothetical protein